MPKLGRLYYIKARVEVDVDLSIAANSIEEARERAILGAWHDVNPKWDKSKLLLVLGDVKEGPKIN